MPNLSGISLAIGYQPRRPATNRCAHHWVPTRTASEMHLAIREHVLEQLLAVLLRLGVHRSRYQNGP